MIKTILVLGGTNFIGRNLIIELLKNPKYDITLFNRGFTNPNLFPEIKLIKGDRNNSDIQRSINQEWDFIIDLSCYYPNSLSRILSQLSIKPRRYIFISTCSVYDMSTCSSTLQNENTPTLTCSANEIIDNSSSTYGKRKAKCERILKKSGIKYTILRPALVYGAYDSSDRLYYWLYNIKKKRDLLIPNQGKNLFSVTYVNDLVNTIIKCIDTRIDSNTYNVITYSKFSIAKLIAITSKIMSTNTQIINVNSNFLKSNAIKEWIDIPLWINNDYFTFNNRKLLNDLRIEPTDIEVSLKETISFYGKSNWYKPIYGIPENKKQELLNKNLENL